MEDSISAALINLNAAEAHISCSHLHTHAAAPIQRPSFYVCIPTCRRLVLVLVHAPRERGLAIDEHLRIV